MSINEEKLRAWIEQTDKKLARLEANQMAIINGDFCDSNTKPKEPRIDNEDARDSVRSWASALQIFEVRCDKTLRGFGVEIVTLEAHRLGSAPRIEFTSGCLDADVVNGEIYTITELCGEDE